MKSITLRELHEATGKWVRRAAALGALQVTERGRPVARIRQRRLQHATG
jgi:antitoxin (DNA-binding transcriptional repressor) of toxin-antitoxin stability system